MTPIQEILTHLVAARISHSGVFPADPAAFVKEARVLAREIRDQDEAPAAIGADLPTATAQSPWDGYGYVGAKWVPVWFDGTTWRRNNSTGADVTATITHWRILSAP